MPNRVRDEQTIKVLLVDDDREDYALTRTLLSEIPRQRFDLEWASTYEAGLARLCEGRHDVYLLDYHLGEKTGLDLLHESRLQDRSGPVILLTGQGEFEIDDAAMKAGAADFLEKSRLDTVLLERAIRYALRQHHYEAELEREVRARTRQLQEEVDERRLAEEKLRELDRRKDEFMATLAHELRNPLAPIRNALEIMRLAGHKGDAFEKARAMLDRQVLQMVRLIDDLLDVARITTGRLHLKLESLSIAEVLTAALELSQTYLDKAEIALAMALPEKTVALQGDRLRLAQVFANLLNNAAKYSPIKGKVSLDVVPDDAQVKITIRDQGIGIAPDLIPHLFDLFTQVDRKTDRSQSGLGIGLALAKMLVEMHGGSILVFSEGPGLGAEFTVTLPLRNQPREWNGIAHHN